MGLDTVRLGLQSGTDQGNDAISLLRRDVESFGKNAAASNRVFRPSHTVNMLLGRMKSGAARDCE